MFKKICSTAKFSFITLTALSKMTASSSKSTSNYFFTHNHCMHIPLTLRLLVSRPIKSLVTIPTNQTACIGVHCTYCFSKTILTLECNRWICGIIALSNQLFSSHCLAGFNKIYDTSLCIRGPV